MAFSDYLSLLNARSAQQIVNEAYTYLASPPDPSLVSVKTANWRTGGPYDFLLKRLGLESALQYNVIAGFASSISVDDAQGGWLDLLGNGFYQEKRQGGEFATVPVTFNIPLGAGPIGPIQLSAQTADGKLFTSTALETLAPGPTSMTFTLQAAQTGAAYNVGAELITQLVTPNILGITVTNASPATGGYDVESDDRYRLRLKNKWGILSGESLASVEAAYIYRALTASKEVKKVRVYSNLNAGVFAPDYVTLILAGDDTGVSGSAVSTVLNAIAPHIPICSKLLVESAVVYPVAVTGIVKVFLPYLATAPGKIAASLTTLNRQVPIGSYDQGPVPVTEVADAVMYDRREIFDTALTNPVTPISLTYKQLLVLSNGTTLTGV